MPEQTKEQGLAPARVVEGELVTAEAYNQQVEVWRRDGFNVLTPSVALSTIPTDHRIVVSRVAINPNPVAGEVYQNSLFTKQGEVAISKVGLEKIAQCAGISIEKIVRTDSQTVPYLWSFQAYGWWIGFDGAKVERVKGRTLDLRDGSDALKGFSANQIAQARVHGEAVCESKAINRVYRSYGVKQKYQQAELERPFIVCKLRYEPDMSNPIVAAIVTQVRMGATKLLFPQAIDLSNVNPLQLPEHVRPSAGPPQADTTDRDDDDDAAPIVGTQGRAPLQLQDFDESAPAAAVDADAHEQVLVTHVGQNASRTDFYITLDDGRVLHTPELTMAKACAAAQKSKTRIAVTIERKGDTLELVELGGGQY
jgi:hypothetical protein